MNPSNPPRQVTRFNRVKVEEIHSNVSQELIEITTDKLKILLTEHLGYVNSNKDWIAPASLLVTIVLVFCTTSFKDALGINMAVWEAAFMLAGVGCLVWLCISLFKIHRSITIDALLDKIKNKNSGEG